MSADVLHGLRTLEDECHAALAAERAFDPSARAWRADIRHADRLSVGRVFTLVADANQHEPVNQFKVLAMVESPEGYHAVWAVESTAVYNQVEIVYEAHVIKQGYLEEV